MCSMMDFIDKIYLYVVRIIPITAHYVTVVTCWFAPSLDLKLSRCANVQFYPIQRNKNVRFYGDSEIRTVSDSKRPVNVYVWNVFMASL